MNSEMSLFFCLLHLNYLLSHWKTVKICCSIHTNLVIPVFWSSGSYKVLSDLASLIDWIYRKFSIGLNSTWTMKLGNKLLLLLLSPAAILVSSLTAIHILLNMILPSPWHNHDMNLLNSFTLFIVFIFSYKSFMLLM